MRAVKADVTPRAGDHVLGRYRFGSSKKSIARKPALKDAEWGAPAGTKYSSPRRHVRVALSIVRRISPSTTIPHCAPWLCSGTDESSRAWNKVAEPVRPWSSHSVTPCNDVSASGNFRMKSGNPVMGGGTAPAVRRSRSRRQRSRGSPSDGLLGVIASLHLHHVLVAQTPSATAIELGRDDQG